MKVSEFKRDQKNGIDNITEAVIGYDGIAFAQNADNPAIDLSREQITLAVAAEVPDPNGSSKLVANPYKRWNQIDASLPDREIIIYGPPTTSGTRDAFEELVMEVATKKLKAYKGAYTKIRQDGPYVPSGENDNLIVKRLTKNKAAFGIFGYSFLAENIGKIQGATIEGVPPRPEAISSGDYPVSRSLFFYIKNDHLDKVAGMREYVKLFMSEKMIGEYGYLKSIGLIPLPKDMRAAARERVLKGSKLKLKDDGTLTSLKDYMDGKE